MYKEGSNQIALMRRLISDGMFSYATALIFVAIFTPKHIM